MRAAISGDWCGVSSVLLKAVTPALIGAPRTLPGLGAGHLSGKYAVDQVRCVLYFACQDIGDVCAACI